MNNTKYTCASHIFLCWNTELYHCFSWTQRLNNNSFNLRLKLHPLEECLLFTQRPFQPQIIDSYCTASIIFRILSRLIPRWEILRPGLAVAMKKKCTIEFKGRADLFVFNWRQRFLSFLFFKPFAPPLAWVFLCHHSKHINYLLRAWGHIFSWWVKGFIPVCAWNRKRFEGFCIRLWRTKESCEWLTAFQKPLESKEK